MGGVAAGFSSGLSCRARLGAGVLLFRNDLLDTAVSFW